MKIVNASVKTGGRERTLFVPTIAVPVIKKVSAAL